MSRVIVVPSGIASMRVLRIADEAPADAALGEAEGGAAAALESSVGASEALEEDILPAAEHLSLMAGASQTLQAKERPASPAACRSVHDFRKRITDAVKYAIYEKLEGLAGEVAAAAEDLEECEFSYFALCFAQGFSTTLFQKTHFALIELTLGLMPKLSYITVPCERTALQMQKAMRQSSLMAALVLMPRLDRVSRMAIVSGVLTFFPNDELIEATAKVARHLEGDDLFAVAREVYRRMPDTFGYNLYPRRTQFYEDCIRFLLDVMPRLQVERRAVIAFHLMDCTYLSDESEDRLYEEGPEPLIPFRTRRAFLDHFFTAREQQELRDLGLRDAVVAELGWNLER